LIGFFAASSAWDAYCFLFSHFLSLSQMNKALFLDLDHTLIRPKSFKSAYVTIPTDHTEAQLAEAYAEAEKKIPSDAVDVETAQLPNAQGLAVGYIFRNTFPIDAEDWEFMPGILNAIKPYFEEGFMMIVISNQGGIEAGHHTFGEIYQKLFMINLAVEEHFGLQDCPAARTDFFFCPSMDKDNPRRKPNHGMLTEAELQYDLNLGLSLMVGDMESDKVCATNAGVSYMDIKEFLRTHA
jgi:D-glycero-D-manno-heptose 1,7-bisphosphate phosphatase